MGTEFLGAGKSTGVDPKYGCEGAGVAGGGPEPMPQRGRDHRCGRFLSGKYGQRQTAGGTGSLEENILPGMLSQSMQYVRWFAELGGFGDFLIASVLLAKDYDGIMNHLLDQESCHVLLEVICGIVRYIATFVKAQGIIMSAIALTAAITLGIAGIKHGVLWGILAWEFWMRFLLSARGWCWCHWESGSYWREASVERLSVVCCMWYVFSCGRYWSPVSSEGK